MNDLHGAVINYDYLWHREYERGEESGRKTRPACIMLIVRGKDGREQALFFPITSQKPMRDTVAVSLPETEARRAGIRLPAWVVVDEFNTDDPLTSPAVADVRPLGVFSRRFMREIAIASAKAIRQRGVRAVPRR